MPAQQNRWQRDDYDAAQRRENSYSNGPAPHYPSPAEEPSPVRWLILAALVFGVIWGIYERHYRHKEH